MPARPARDDPADALARAYVEAFRRLTVQEARLFDPRNWRALERTRAVQARVLREVARLDRTAQSWVTRRLPGVYRGGAQEFSSLMRDAGVRGRFEFTQLHQEALRSIAGDTLTYLLDGNGHIATRVRDAVRTIARDETVQKVIDGKTGVQEGRVIAGRLRDELGFTSIPDRNGRLMPLDHYAETVARTQSGLAYNRGEFAQAVEERVEWLEVFDGFGCGWAAHNDPDTANGTVRSVDDAAAYPLAHPRCLRSFAPRPDLGLAKSRRELAERVDLGERAGATVPSSSSATRGLQARKDKINAGRRARVQARKENERAGLGRAGRVQTRVNEALRDGQDTESLYKTEAGWSPERARMHDRIVQEIVDEHANVPKEGRAIFSGGLPGAGKSTMLDSPLAEIDQSKFVTINPDDMKERIAAHGGLPDVPGLKPNEMAALVHEESSDLAKQVAARLASDGTNMIWDITMSSPKQVLDRLDALDGRYGPRYTDTRAMFVQIDTAKSKERALGRYLRKWDTPDGGRFVPPHAIDAMRDAKWGSSNRRAFEESKHRFSSWQLWDNMGAGPRQLDAG